MEYHRQPCNTKAKNCFLVSFYRITAGCLRASNFKAGTRTYHAVPEEAQVAARGHAQMEHCKKLLKDLPIALQNSITAMEAHAVSEDVDLTTLGAMVLEQTRIKQEIKMQKAKVDELEAIAALEGDQRSLMVTHKFQTTLILPFGVTTLDQTAFAITLLSTAVNAQAPKVRVIQLRV
jgi:hypothetical protein